MDKLHAMQVSAPAKINLSLRILGKRPDGFHDIETFIAPISLCDRLELEKVDGPVEFTCDDPSLPVGDDNLVVRAAHAFFARTGREGGVSIRLEKKIPHGAGLGGGSSDAAATLMALNELYSTNLPREALAEMGATLGSDIPFFFFQSAALCRGRGEIVSPQRLADQFSLLLLKPDFGVPSGWAYSRWTDSREIPGPDYQPQDLGGHTFVNDLERPVFEKFVFLGQMKSWLRRQPEVSVAAMAGSGSTVFGVLKNGTAGEGLADRAKKELDPKLWSCVVTTT